MIIKADSEDIEIEFDKHILFSGKPKFNPFGPFIILSNYNTYQELHSNPDIYGSMRFLMSENDILAFSKTNHLLNAIELEIPFDAEIIQDSIKINGLGAINLASKQEKMFWLPRTTNVQFYTESDFLLLGYKKISNPENYSFFNLAEDFFVIIKNDSIAGWGLQNCSKYLYSSYDGSYDNSDTDKVELVTTFLTLYNEHSFELIRDKDHGIKQRYISFYKRAKTLKSYVMCELIEDWLGSEFPDLLQGIEPLRFRT